jgi:hypothetical protein
LGKKYKETGVFEVDQYEKKVGEILPGCGGRTIKGYANLIWFSEQVICQAEINLGGPPTEEFPHKTSTSFL